MIRIFIIYKLIRIHYQFNFITQKIFIDFYNKYFKKPHLEEFLIDPNEI